MRVFYHHRTQGRGAEGVHITSVVLVLEALRYSVDILSPPGVDPRAEAGSYLYTEASSKKGGATRWLWRLLSRHAPQIIFEWAELCYSFFALPRLFRYARRTHVDLVYERYAFFLWAGAFFARWKRLPLILEVNEVCGIQRARKQILVRVMRWVESYVFRSADTIVVVSSFLRQTLLSRGVDSNKIVVVPNGVDHQKFHPEVSANGTRQAWRAVGKVVFGFVGWIDPWDEIPFLIEVFAEVHRLRPEAMLVIVGRVVGDGLGMDDLRRKIAKLGLEKAVVLAGGVPRDRMPETIAALDVGVIPHSNPFGSPVVLFEFMACGKPVIAPDLGPLQDVLRHGENGFLFPPQDRAAFKEIFLHLIANPQARLEVGAAARRCVLEEHSWEVKVKKILAFHQRRLEGVTVGAPERQAAR